MTGKYTEKDRETKRLYYQRNKERILAYNRAWHRDNPEKRRETHRAWCEKNPERKAEITRAYYERNRDEVLARQRKRDADLSDSVVKSRFCCGTGLQSRDVPPELIPAIRTSMLIRRELKKAKK